MALGPGRRRERWASDLAKPTVPGLPCSTKHELTSCHAHRVRSANPFRGEAQSLFVRFRPTTASGNGVDIDAVLTTATCGRHYYRDSPQRGGTGAVVTRRTIRGRRLGRRAHESGAIDQRKATRGVELGGAVGAGKCREPTRGLRSLRGPIVRPPTRKPTLPTYSHSRARRTNRQWSLEWTVTSVRIGVLDVLPVGFDYLFRTGVWRPRPRLTPDPTHARRHMRIAKESPKIRAPHPGGPSSGRGGGRCDGVWWCSPGPPFVPSQGCASDPRSSIVRECWATLRRGRRCLRETERICRGENVLYWPIVVRGFDTMAAFAGRRRATVTVLAVACETLRQRALRNLRARLDRTRVDRARPAWQVGIDNGGCRRPTLPQ